MNMLKLCRISLLRRAPSIIRIHYYATSVSEEDLRNLLGISESEARYMCLKHPVIKTLDRDRIKCSLNTLSDIGFSQRALIEEPVLFSILPITLKYRYKVLEECGIVNITSHHILSYLTIVKQKTISKLRKSNLIPSFVNLENRLASFMTQWPTSLTSSIYGDTNLTSLYYLRLNIIQRYLELVLDLTKEEFERGIKTYPTIKHRPLQTINETLNILQSIVMMPNHKIKNNLYLVHVDPDNLKQIIYSFRTIGGIDIKEIIRLHPKLATKNYMTLVEIRNILKEYGISNEAQVRCFDIYTLGPKTIKERLENAKTIPEFSTFLQHPRFLRMIHYKNTAMKRMLNLYKNDKKCLSLNILSGSSAHYKVFEKAPGDRLGKGKDLVFCISQSLGEKYSNSEIRNIINRHPFWINIPLVQVKYVYQRLSIEYSPCDIYENCPILLYPWSKIKEAMKVLKDTNKINQKSYFHDCLDINLLTKSQKLSLVLYLLEKNHYFTGNGVWFEEKNVNVVELNILDKKITNVPKFVCKLQTQVTNKVL